MLTDRNQFQSIQSKHSKGFTLLIKIFSVTMSIAILLTAISILKLTIVGGLTKIEGGIRILLITIAILLIVFIMWLLIVQFKSKPPEKITHIIVDKDGLHHYKSEELIKSINYNDLQVAPHEGQYDVFFYSPPETEASSDLCIYLYDERSKIPVRKAVFFDCDTVITNGNQLLTHFIKGVILFRPNLRIEPNVFEVFKM